MRESVPTLPATLLPSRLKYSLLLVLSLVFVAMGAFLLTQQASAVAAWGCIVFFGLGAIVFALILFVPGASSLQLDTNGFVVRSLFRSHRTAWKDVAGFRPVRIGVKKFVGFDFAPGVPASRKLRRVNSAMVGAEAALPDSYGVSVDKLSGLLNDLLATHR